jgi:hypothetical protein
MLFVDERGSFLHGLFWVKYGRKDFILDLDKIESLFGDLRICGRDGSNLVSQGADFVGFERDVVFINTEFDGRDIVTRQNSLHPGKFLCP